MSPLDKINTRRLVIQLRRQVSKILKRNGYKPDLSEKFLKEQVSSYLYELQNITAVKSFSVGEMTETYHGWRELYPNVGKRILAWTAAKLKLNYRPNKQCWYHTVFPFVVDYIPYIREGYYDADKVGAFYDHEGKEYVDTGADLVPISSENVDDAIGIRYWAGLKVPYKSQDMNILIHPVSPVSMIKVDFVVTKEKVDFGIVDTDISKLSGA